MHRSQSSPPTSARCCTARRRPPHPPRPRHRRRRRRTSAPVRPSPREAFRTLSDHLVTRLGIAGLLLTSVMFLVFETVGTQLWYDAHQSGLQQDFLTNGKPISKGKSAGVVQIPALNLKLT